MRQGSRRYFLQGSLTLASLGLLSGCGTVPISGQPASGGASRPRIGYLEGSTPSRFETFREGLREFGYVDGQNLLVEYRFAEGNSERLPSLVAELVDSRVELIVARDTFSGVALSRATSAIPIVMVVNANSLVTNIAHPEANITGLNNSAPDLAAKWVQLLHEAVPTISRLATLSDPSLPQTEQNRREAERAALVLQLRRPSHYDLRDLNQLSGVLSTVKAAGADGLVMLSGGALGGNGDPRIGGQVLGVGLPAIAENRDFVLAGGLLAYGVSANWNLRRSATYVARILAGAKPADLPVEAPTQFDLVVNRSTAKALGLTVPQSVLDQATEVIQ